MKKTLYTRRPSAALIRRAQKVADGLITTIAPFPKGIKGRGIVTCGGGYTYFTNAWVLIRMLRHHGCKLPIQLWYLGPDEISDRMKRFVSGYGVECVDGAPMIRENTNVKDGLIKAGWLLKSVAIAKCSFEEVLFLDADNLPVRDPSFLFETRQYKSTGAIFWPDSSVFAHKSVWRVFRVPRRVEPEFESGQMMVNKRTHWEAVSLAEQINGRADVFYRLMWGDKDSFRFAWHKLGRTFAMPKFPPQALQAAGSAADMLCQHDFDGNRLFQHRIMYKWNLFGENPWIPGFFFESECRVFVEELKLLWDGRCGDSTVRMRGFDARSVEREFTKTVWLLKVAQVSRKKMPETRLELGFDKNGTLRKNAGQDAGVFWDIRKSATGLQLTLWDEDGPKVKLRPAEIGWRGRWFNEKHKVKATMQALESVYPHLRQPVARSASSKGQEIRCHFGDEVHVGHSAKGIGDHIVGVYACTGLARKGVRVVFHTRHAEWLSRVREPGLIITSKRLRRIDHDLEYDYLNQLRYGTSRALWYAGGLHPFLKPAKPQVDRTQEMNRLPFRHYILLAPLARRPTREWPEIHWTRLAHLLREAGYEVVAIGGKNHKEKLQNIFVDTQAYWVADHPAAWVMDAMLGAAAYIGIDSGMTHLAALLGIKTVAIHSQLKAEFLWPMDRVKSLTPDARCVFCRWQHDRGFQDSCGKHCSALALVAPETVLDAVLDLANNRNVSDPKRDHPRRNPVMPRIKPHRELYV